MICIWYASQKLVCWRHGVEFVVLIGNGRIWGRELGPWQPTIHWRDLGPFLSALLPSAADLSSFAFPLAPCYGVLPCHESKVTGPVIIAEMSEIMSPCIPALFRYFVSGRELTQKMIQITDGVPRASSSCNSFPEGPPSSHQPLPVFSPVNTFLPYWSNSLCAPSGPLHYPPERMGTDLLRLCRIF